MLTLFDTTYMLVRTPLLIWLLMWVCSSTPLCSTLPYRLDAPAHVRRHCPAYPRSCSMSLSRLSALPVLMSLQNACPQITSKQPSTCQQLQGQWMFRQSLDDNDRHHQEHAGLLISRPTSHVCSSRRWEEGWTAAGFAPRREAPPVGQDLRTNDFVFVSAIATVLLQQEKASMKRLGVNSGETKTVSREP